MSWYNDNTENNFIDATQEHIGENVSTSTTIIENVEDLEITETTPDTGTDTTIGNVLLPAVFNEEEGTFDLYIRNTNQGGRIFFKTRGDGEQIKIEDGKLYLYYYYNPFISAVIPPGWTDVITYLISNRQGINNNSALIVAAGGAIATLQTEIGTLNGTLQITIQNVNTNSLRILELEKRANIEDISIPSIRDTMNELQEELANYLANNFMNIKNFKGLFKYLKTRKGLVNAISSLLGIGGSIGAIGAIVYEIIDEINKLQNVKDKITLANSLEALKSNTDRNTVDKIYKDGLQIQSATNGGMVDGFYEIEFNQDAKPTIFEITVVNGVASITNILGTEGGFSIGDVISLDKTELGAISGTLDIDVNQVYSMVDLIDLELLKLNTDNNDINNRQRRRQNIPTSSSFSSDGFNIVNTQITEPSNEITNEPTINLKIDTSQFQYDGTGNLQIKSSILAPSIATDPLQFITDVNTGNLQLIDYDKIAEIGDDTVGAETGLYQYVLNKIEETLGDQETYDANGNVIVPATNIYQEINNIYELVMVGDQTFQNNNDYKLNLGYKTIWTGYAYDLITIALKAVRNGIFDSSYYNNDWLGYFPSLTRISDDQYMTSVKDVNIEILTNLTFKKGLIYFVQNDPVVDYNLNRKFEFVCFIRPIDTDNTGVEYTLLQTGVEIGPGQYDLDNYKLKLGFRDNKFEITHNVKREVEYYQTLTTKNYYNPGAVSDILVQNATTGITSISKYVPPNNIQMLWGIFSQQSYKNVLPWANLDDLLERDDTYTYFSNSVFKLYDWNFNILRDMVSPATTIWSSPKIIFHEYNDINLPRRGIGKLVIKYEYMYASTQGNLLQTKTFTSQNDIDNNLEFKLRINIKKYNDPSNTIYGSRIYDITEWQYDPVSLNPPAGNVSFYKMTLWMPHITYPLLSTDEYNYIELELVHRGGSFTPLPIGTQSYNFYTNQHSLRIYSINYFEYDTTPTTFVDHSAITFQDTTNFFPTPLDANHWYKVVAELDLPNKVVQYWVDNINHYFTFDTVNNISHSSLQLPQSDPTVPYFYSANWEYTNNTYTGLVRDNDIIVIGNEPSSGELNFTHFAWKHFQNPLENYMIQTERDKLDILINYNYYYETVKVDRYLKVKEFYADILDARKILINGGFAYNELSPGDQITLLRSEDQSSDNVAITNAFVNIDKLFVSDPVASGNGFLSYNSTSKEFTISSSTISGADVENAVGSLVKISPSTYGFIFNQTDPADKFLQIDDVYINSLVNLVIQNEIVLTNSITDAEYNDVLIQIKDSSSYSPYNLRELDDTDVRYNYKINGNHQYLYRELNQEIQYDPLLGVAFGSQYPVVMYHFQGVIINNARSWLTGIPASDYDFEMLVPGGQVVYGSGPLNMKNFNGVEGGNTEIRTKNIMAISSADRSCISFFHKPFGSNIDGTDDHILVKFVDTNNYPVFYIKLEYVSNNAIYKLVFVNPGNINDETSFTFNNSENEIYFGNENCILLWCDQPYWHFYINGKYHGVSINQTYSYGASGIRDCKILIDLNNFNNRSLLYELKIYPKLLFKTASGGNLSSNDLIFNNKVVVDVTEMIRIITFTSGGFILKELSGVQETKSRSISTRRRVKVLESSSSSSSYSDADVKALLANMGGTNITWNVANEQFDNDFLVVDDVSQANFDTKFNAKTVDDVSQANFDTKFNAKTVDDVSQVNFDTKFNAKTFFGNTDVETLLTTNHITFNANYIQFDDNIRVNDNKIFKFGTNDTYGTEMLFNSTNNKLEYYCKNGTGAVEIRKIIIKGVSGLTSQVADWREFEFFGITGGYSSGDRRSVITATTNMNYSQYPFTPVVGPAEWVSGGKEIYAYNGVDNSPYLVGSQVVDATKHFTFEFTGGNYPSASTFTGLRIYWDRPTWTGSSGSQGTWSFIIEDQNGIQHTMITSFELLQMNGFTNNQYAYLDINTNITYPTGTPATSDIYDITTQDGKINIKQELGLSANGIKFSDGTILTTAPSTGASYPLNVANTGLTLTNGGIDVFEKDLWFNSSDGKNRLYFTNVGDTIIRAPANAGNPDINLEIGTTTKLQVNNSFVKVEVPLLFSDGTQISTVPTLPALITANAYELDDIACIYFTDPLAFIKGDKLTLRGITSGGGGSGNATETEDFTNAQGTPISIMSGFNANLFDNGSNGSANVIPGSSSPNNLGQISGQYGSIYTGVRNSGGGTGSAGNFNSSSSTGKSKYFLLVGGPYRSLRTKNISSILSTCTSISFHYIAGTQSNGGNYPEGNENLDLEFLSQYGNPLSSVRVHSGGTTYSGGTNFTFFTHTLTTAQQSCYYVRWIQYNTSSGNYDHYGFTNVTFNYVGSTPPTTTDIDVRLENLPTSAPTESNRLWKDSSGYLRLT